jgi:hypothetical protein
MIKNQGKTRRIKDGRKKTKKAQQRTYIQQGE